MAALEDKDHVEESKTLNKKGLLYLQKELNNLGIDYTESNCNFILIDLKQDPMPVYNELLKQGVIVRPVGGYGLKTHLRVSIGRQSENEKFIESIKKVLKI